MKEYIKEFLIYGLISIFLSDLINFLLVTFVLDNEFVLLHSHLSSLLFSIILYIIYKTGFRKSSILLLAQYTLLNYIALIVFFFSKYLRFEFGFSRFCVNTKIDKELLIKTVNLEGIIVLITVLLLYQIFSSTNKSLFTKPNIIYLIIITIALIIKPIIMHLI